MANAAKISAEADTSVPIIFVSTFEHNSNLLPWRQTGAKVVVIPISDNGDFDYSSLEHELRAHSHEVCLKVGSFAAGSNLTGTLIDTDRIAVLCHTYGVLACFDYAAIAPYVDINMNGIRPFRRFHFDPKPQAHLAYFDAVYVSTHKMIGGPGASGVLIVKKALLSDPRPDRPGGGPVFFVNELDHEFIAQEEELEEAGTPGILQDIKAGLAFQLKEAISEITMYEKSKIIREHALKRMYAIPNLYLMGNNNIPKVTIFSFVIKSRFGKILHHNFVTSLLNDIFGIQTRAGCICAAMWGMKILGIDSTISQQYREALYDGHEVLKMGYTRFNFAFFMSMEEVDYIIDAIEFICKYGWMFLPCYIPDAKLSIWVHQKDEGIIKSPRITEIDYHTGKMTINTTNPHEIFKIVEKDSPNKRKPLPHYIEQAKEHLVQTVNSYEGQIGRPRASVIPKDYESRCWFLLPEQVFQDLAKLGPNATFEQLASMSNSPEWNQQVEFTSLFHPRTYNKRTYPNQIDY